MSAPSECPICLCVITGTNDSTTTNCGHCFHTGCLLKNVMRNGSKCPCCRNEMVAPNETADTNETVSSANDPPQNIQFQIMRVKKVIFLSGKINGHMYGMISQLLASLNYTK